MTTGNEIERVEIDLDEAKAAMEQLQAQAGQFASTFASQMRQAFSEGLDVEGMIRQTGMAAANRALSEAMAPLEEMISSLLARLLSGLGGALAGGISAPAGAAGAVIPNIIMNVQSGDAEGFRKSQAQIFGLLTRAARSGARML